MSEPGYLSLFRSGILAEKAHLLEESLESCELCPRRCRVDRLAGKVGVCGVDARAKVAAINIHPWEEPPISGSNGSGTIFFSGCAMKCLFCQNYPISQMGVGRYMTPEELARGMMQLQERGAHNINLVTPTHQAAAMVKALVVAASLGLSIPIVCNTSGYERVETLRLLEGVVDIYLPDIKYADPKAAGFCSGCTDYVLHSRKALLEMRRQVGGPLQIGSDGIAERGLLIRHMVLPDDLSGTHECMSFLKEKIGLDVWISLMNQYFPAHKALEVPPLDRKASTEEYDRAFEAVTDLGLENGFVQLSPEEEIC